MGQIIDKVSNQYSGFKKSLKDFEAEENVRSQFISPVLENWLPLIPEYSGSPYHILYFVDSIKMLMDSLKITDKRMAIFAGARKLRGDAERVMRGKISEFESIEAFAQELYRHFGIKFDIIHEKLVDLEQGEDERLQDYVICCERINTLLKTFKRFGYSISGLSINEQNSFINTIDYNSMVCFMRGLRNKGLEFAVWLKSPKTLDEAIQLTLELEPVYYNFINPNRFSLLNPAVGMPEEFNDRRRRRSNSESPDMPRRRPRLSNNSDSDSADSGLPDSTNYQT